MGLPKDRSRTAESNRVYTLVMKTASLITPWTNVGNLECMVARPSYRALELPRGRTGVVAAAEISVSRLARNTNVSGWEQPVVAIEIWQRNEQLKIFHERAPLISRDSDLRSFFVSCFEVFQALPNRESRKSLFFSTICFVLQRRPSSRLFPFHQFLHHLVSLHRLSSTRVLTSGGASLKAGVSFAALRCPHAKKGIPKVVR
ncbi:hypothetical protein R1flu_020463 [Riccia fluitans]|uniref:Uncharacterized protein n=1 Tax=Riccia fluitans TaxID=41844 RepID=A0ABD1ZLL1_9MARC